MSETIGKFRSLSPSNDALDVDNYVEFLHSVATDNTKNTDFGNIALTGDIGIGKSSIVRTYEKKYNYKFVYITAGDLGYRFERDEITGLPRLPKKKSECSTDKESQEEVDTEQTEDVESQQNEENSLQNNLQDKPKNTVNLKDDEAEKLSEEIQQKLEKNLLEQLIALCKSNDIPRSRFQTVPENAANKKLWLSLYPIFCIIAVFCGFKLIANNFIKKDYLNFIDLEPFMWLILIIFISSSIGIAVRKIITHYKFTKLSLNVGKEDTGSASAEIDMDESENASLDTNLHEIIYIFEQLAEKKSGENEERPPVFVIEDVDRYPAEICFPILTKFKQINDMLNSRYRLNHSGYDKHYKFIYTLNDKIFDDSQGGRCVSDNDPYKFFDVIIPVIPKLSFANSLSILKNDFKNYKIDEGFFKKISFYIFDFRKLHDIENEFIVYYEKFQDKLDNTQTETTDNSEDKKEKLTTTALLAFVMYKIFYKGEYYKLFRTNKKGVPLSSLMKKYLRVFDNEKRTTDILEGILERYFEKNIDEILEMDEDVKNKYIAAIIADDKDIDLNKVDMRYIDFSGQNLYGRDFSNQNLTGADFSGANLSRANLMGAILEEAILEQAELEGANLINAKLNNASLYNAYIADADLEGAELKNTILVGAVLVSASLKNANLEHAKLDGTNLNYTNLKGSNIKNISYYYVTTWKEATYDFDTEFSEDFNPKKYSMILDLKNEHLESADLKGKDLSNALLQQANLQRANLQQANLHGANLENAILQGAKLQEAKLQYANLQDSNLKSANLKNILYNNTKWRNAHYNFKTYFPKHFKPQQQGMILDLSGEDLKNMDLRGKDLSRAWLYGTNLENVTYDETTIWTGAKYDSFTTIPKGLNPQEYSMEILND